MQRALNAVTDRATPLNATGVFNAVTGEALRVWQRKVGLAPTGVVGTLSWQAFAAGKLR